VRWSFRLRPLQNAPFAQFLRQTQNLILEILNVFLWLNFSSSLNLNEIKHFAKVLDSLFTRTAALPSQKEN